MQVTYCFNYYSFITCFESKSVLPLAFYFLMAFSTVSQITKEILGKLMQTQSLYICEIPSFAHSLALRTFTHPPTHPFYRFTKCELVTVLSCWGDGVKQNR